MTLLLIIILAVFEVHDAIYVLMIVIAIGLMLFPQFMYTGACPQPHVPQIIDPRECRQEKKLSQAGGKDYCFRKPLDFVRGDS